MSRVNRNPYSRSLAPTTRVFKELADARARPVFGSFDRFLAVQRERVLRTVANHEARQKVRAAQLLESQGLPMQIGDKRDASLLQVTIRGSAGSDCHPGEHFE